MENSETKKQSFSYSTEVNGIRKSVNVRQVENGWIVRVDKSWDEKNLLGQSDYRSEEKEYISSTDPRDLIKKKDPEEKESSIVGSVNSLMEELAGLQGMLIVP